MMVRTTTLLLFAAGLLGEASGAVAEKSTPAGVRAVHDSRPASAGIATDKPSKAPAFTGFAGIRGVFEASLHDPDTGRCTWVRLRDPEAPYYLESFDERSRTLVIVSRGNRFAVRLKHEGAVGPAPADETKPVPPPPMGYRGEYWHPRGEYTVVGPGGRAPDDPGLDD